MSQKEIEIPKGWELKKISDIGTILTGSTPDTRNSEYFGNDFPFYSPSDLNLTIEIIRSKKGLSKKGFDVSRKIPEDSILVQCIGDLGKCAIVKKEGACNQQINVIIPNKQIVLPKFVYYWIKSSYFINLMSKKASQTTLPILNKSKFMDLPFFLPSLPIQNKIIQKLDDILRILEEKKKIIYDMEEKKRTPKLLKQIIQYLLLQAFSGNLTKQWRQNHPLPPSIIFLEEIRKARIANLEKISNSKNFNKKNNLDITIFGPNKDMETWTDTKLENLIYISGRIGWKGLTHDEYVDSGPAFLSVHSLNYGDVVDFRHAFHIPQWRYDESPEIQLKENDILLAKDGAGIGKIGIIKDLDQQATVNTSLLVIRSLEAFLPEYLFYYLKGPTMQDIAQKRIMGSATPHLFQKDIKQFTLSVPPIEEQKEIVSILKKKFEELERYRSKIEHISKIRQILLKNLDSINASVLNSAFSGKLYTEILT